MLIWVGHSFVIFAWLSDSFIVIILLLHIYIWGLWAYLNIQSSILLFELVQEAAENNCVYRNEVHHSVGERTQVLQDVAADPTLPRTKSVRCAVCNHGEAVFFQVWFLKCIHLQSSESNICDVWCFLLCTMVCFLIICAFFIFPLFLTGRRKY